MENLFILLGILLAAAIVITLADIITFGEPLSKRMVKIYLKKDFDEFTLNPFDTSILLRVNGNFITNTPVKFLFKYYIDNEGLIWRWSKLSKKIDAEFEKRWNHA